MSRKKKTEAAKESPPSDAPKTDNNDGDVSDIVESIEESSPEPNREFIESMNAEREQNEQQQKEQQTKSGGLVDSLGRSFDPSLHLVDEQGNPKLTQAGLLRRKRGKSKVGAAAKKDQQVIPAGELTPEQKEGAKMSGRICADMFIQTCTLLGGPEWKPVESKEQNIDERKELREAAAMYCEAKQVTDVPPGVLLGFVVMAYAVPRFTMPKTQSRLQTAKLWIATKLQKMKGKKGNAAHSDLRHDGKRKDNASESDSERKT